MREAVAGNVVVEIRVVEIRVVGDLAVAADSPEGEAGEVGFTFRLAEAVRLRPHAADRHRRTTTELPRSVSRTSADRRVRSQPRPLREREHGWERLRQKFRWMAAEPVTSQPARQSEPMAGSPVRSVNLERTWAKGRTATLELELAHN